jgi:hypothetical protein
LTDTITDNYSEVAKLIEKYLSIKERSRENYDGQDSQRRGQLYIYKEFNENDKLKF